MQRARQLATPPSDMHWNRTNAAGMAFFITVKKWQAITYHELIVCVLLLLN